MVIKMNEENYIITNNEQLETMISSLERLFLSLTKPINLKLSVTKEMLDKTINAVVPHLRFSDLGIISHLEILNRDYLIYDEDYFSLNHVIREKCIIKFPIPRDMTLQIYSHVLILNQVQGTIILMDEDASVYCESLNSAKIITMKNSKDNFTHNQIFIKGDDLL